MHILLVLHDPNTVVIAPEIVVLTLNICQKPLDGFFEIVLKVFSFDMSIAFSELGRVCEKVARRDDEMAL